MTCTKFFVKTPEYRDGKLHVCNLRNMEPRQERTMKKKKKKKLRNMENPIDGGEFIFLGLRLYEILWSFL
jgi:hypothetical protein